LKTKIGELTCLSPNAGLKLVRYSIDVHAIVYEHQLRILLRSISVTQIVWTPYKFWMCHERNRSQKNLGWKRNPFSVNLIAPEEKSVYNLNYFL